MEPVADEDITLNRKNFLHNLRNPQLPQAKGVYLDIDSDRKPKAACALGIGAYQANPEISCYGDDLVKAVNDLIVSLGFKDPDAGPGGEFWRFVTHLNDDAELSFAEIADKLEERWEL
jgi:hypothetical protein